MAQASQKTKLIRKLKRERTFLRRALKYMEAQMITAQKTATFYKYQLEQAQKPQESDLVITKVTDEQSDSVDRQDENSNGLEMPESQILGV